MIDTLDHIDKLLFYFLNSIHSPFWDEIMIVITGKLTWIPLYALLLFLLIRLKKKKSLLFILAIPLLIIWADRISSGLFKPGVERLRPCYNTSLTQPVHNPNGCGGQYGFFSSHASNTFAIAAFLFGCFRKKHQWSWGLFVWAAIVSYSRVYLGVHYPGDVIAGGVFGTLSGFLFYYLAQKATQKWLRAY